MLAGEQRREKVDVFLVEYALMSHDAQYTKFVQDVYESVGYETLLFMLERL